MASGTQPKDKKGNRPEPKAILNKRKKKHLRIIADYLAQIKNHFEDWPYLPNYNGEEILYLADLLEGRLRAYFHTGKNITFKDVNIIRKEIGNNHQVSQACWDSLHNLLIFVDKERRKFKEPKIIATAYRKFGKKPIKYKIYPISNVLPKMDDSWIWRRKVEEPPPQPLQKIDYKLWAVELKLNTLKKNLIYASHQIGIIQTLIDDLIMKLHETQYVYAFGHIAYKLKCAKIKDMQELLNDLTKAIIVFKQYKHIYTPE